MSSRLRPAIATQHCQGLQSSDSSHPGRTVEQVYRWNQQAISTPQPHDAASARDVPLPPSASSSLEGLHVADIPLHSHGNSSSRSAEAVALPPSASSSLQQLQHGSANGNEGALHDISSAQNVSLPESRPSTISIVSEHTVSATSNHSGRNSIPQSVSASHQSFEYDHSLPCYWDSIALLAGNLPHIKVLRDAADRDEEAGLVSCYDYLEGNRLPQVHCELRCGHWPGGQPSQRFANLRLPDNPAILNRVILVEDLSQALIDALGRTFELDPEFFAEHLNRSGYRQGSYREDLPARWITSSLTKPYTSLKWYRPVQQHSRVATWLKEPERLLSLDPAESHVSWRDEHQEDRGDYLIQSYTLHNACISSNIFRRSWSLSTRPNDAHGGLVPSAFEERATYCHYHTGKVLISIILLDPLPGIVDHQTTLANHFRKEPFIFLDSDTRQNCVPVEVVRPTVPRSVPTVPKNKFYVDASHIGELRSALLQAESTTSSMAALMTRGAIARPQSDVPGPVLSLVLILHADSKAILAGLHAALDEISQDSLDDYLMTRRLPAWRRLLSDVEIEVPALRNSLKNFIDYTFADQASVPPAITDLMKDLDSAIALFMVRMKEAQAALRADISILESRRSITETETVTKLTELAFAFIPLTFACSLFSMQVNELEGGVPLRSFIIAAIIVASISYGLRIAVTSEFVSINRRRALEMFWEAADLQRGSQVPTYTLFLLTLREIWRPGGPAWRFIIFLVMASLTAVPLAFQWQQTQMDVSLSVMVTLLLLPGGIALAWLFSTQIWQDDSGLPPFQAFNIWLARVRTARRTKPRPSAPIRVASSRSTPMLG